MHVLTAVQRIQGCSAQQSRPTDIALGACIDVTCLLLCVYIGFSFFIVHYCLFHVSGSVVRLCFDLFIDWC